MTSLVRKYKGRGHDATGRSKSEGESHVRLYHWFTNTAAWADLTTAERCVYIEIEKRFNGVNNGSIGLSARVAGKACRISKDTANRAFAGLIEHGFVECTTPGGFGTNSCLAPEWRLTRADCDVTKTRRTDAYKKWKLPDDEARRREEQRAERAARIPERSPKKRTVLSENKDSPKAKTA